jgi:hypothetical protein
MDKRFDVQWRESRPMCDAAPLQQFADCLAMHSILFSKVFTGLNNLHVRQIISLKLGVLMRIVNALR